LSNEGKNYITHVEIGTQWSKGLEVENDTFKKKITTWFKQLYNRIS